MKISKTHHKTRSGIIKRNPQGKSELINQIKKRYNKFSYRIGKNFVKAKELKRYDGWKQSRNPENTKIFIIYAEGIVNNHQTYILRFVEVYNDGSFASVGTQPIGYDQKWRIDKKYDSFK